MGGGRERGGRRNGATVDSPMSGPSPAVFRKRKEKKREERGNEKSDLDVGRKEARDWDGHFSGAATAQKTLPFLKKERRPGQFTTVFRHA